MPLISYQNMNWGFCWNERQNCQITVFIVLPSDFLKEDNRTVMLTYYCQSFRKSETSWSSIDDVFSLKSDMNISYQASTNQRQHLNHVISCWPIHGRIDIQMLLLEIFYHHDLNIEQNPNQVEWISLRLISTTLISTHQLYISTISPANKLNTNSGNPGFYNNVVKMLHWAETNLQASKIPVIFKKIIQINLENNFWMDQKKVSIKR